MPRGRTLATKKKDWYWQRKEEVLGELEARAEFESRQPKLTENQIMHRIQGWLTDKIKELDPIEVLEIGGIAVIIQPMILKSEKLTTYKNNVGSLLIEVGQNLIVGPLGVLFPQIKEAVFPDTQSSNYSTQDIILSWILAIVLAILVVRLVPKLMSGVTNISSMFDIDALLGMLLFA